MKVTIYVSGGVGQAMWEDECGKECEEFVGEVSDGWLDSEAEQYFAQQLGEEIQIEVINADLRTYKIGFVDVYEGDMAYTTVDAEDRESAEKLFEEQSDGCAIVTIKEIR